MNLFEAPLIHVTRDYNMFKFHKQNRRVGSNKRIKNSITRIDLTPYVPVIVDNDYYIIDGQNRFVACKELNKPVYYVVMDSRYSTDSAIIALNQNQKVWRQEEFLHFQAETKGRCYKELEDFFKEHSNLGISNVMVIYPDKAINANTLRIGTMKFSKNPFADDIAEYLNSDEVRMLKYGNTRPFVLATRKAFEVYDKKQLNKLKKYLITIPHCADYEQYLFAFNNILCKK